MDSPTIKNNDESQPLEVTVPSHRYHTSPINTTTASSFTHFPPPPYPISYSSQEDVYHPPSSSWEYPQHEYNNLPSQQHIIKSHPRWSPESSSSSHPYKQEEKSTKERRHRKQPHELLSESQKKANHIASEQKRRQNIRIGFDQLIDIVPSLNHGNRSEALILQKSVDHIRHLISMKNELKNQVRELQGTLGDTNYEEDSSEDELMYSY